MKDHFFRIFLGALVIGSALNSCVEPQYMGMNNYPGRHEKKQHRDKRRNERSFFPFYFSPRWIFPLTPRSSEMELRRRGTYTMPVLVA